MKMENQEMQDKLKSLFEAIGQIVVSANTLDQIAAKIIIGSYHLGDAMLLESVVTTLDPARKIEMIKSRAQVITAPDWKKALLNFAEGFEKVNIFRNIACHSALSFHGEEPVLASFAAPKVLKALAKSRKQGIPDEKFKYYTSAVDFIPASELAEKLFSEGNELVARFNKFNEFAEQRRPGLNKRSRPDGNRKPDKKPAAGR